MAKRRISKKKVSILVIILLIILIALGAFFFLNKNTKTEPQREIKTTDKIKGYNYTLTENATKYQKKLFKELKNLLESDDIDEDKYADLVTKLFITDFFNLDNKISKSDIGGVQFVYKDFREDFKKSAQTTMYKSLESDLYGDRKQTLPVVTNVSTEKGDEESFKYSNNTDEKAKKINFDITYKEDLGYQTSGTLTIIHNGKKLEIAKMEESNN